MKVKTVNPEFSSQEKNFLFLFLQFCIHVSWWMFTKLTLIIISSCKSNHYAAHLKLIQCCIPVTSVKLEEKIYIQGILHPQPLSHVWLFVTPRTVASSSVYGIFQARILEWVGVSYSRGFTAVLFLMMKRQKYPKCACQCWALPCAPCTATNGR